MLQCRVESLREGFLGLRIYDSESRDQIVGAQSN